MKRVKQRAAMPTYPYFTVIDGIPPILKSQRGLEWCPLVGASDKYWHGPVMVSYAIIGETEHGPTAIQYDSLACTIRAPCHMGKVTTTTTSSIRVKMYYGELCSRLPLEMKLLKRVNAAAISADGHTWDFIRFQKAELTDTNDYELTEIVSSKDCNEYAGCRFVVINEALVPADVEEELLEYPGLWVYGYSPDKVRNQGWKGRHR